MPTMPAIKATTGLFTSAGIMNSIFADESIPYFENAPWVEDTTESIKNAGQYITSYVPRRNAFVNALVNRIGMVRLNYMLFTNPWSWAKQGKLEMGETVEQIWNGLASAFPYNPKKSESRVLKMQDSPTKVAFHSVNYKEVYKITINEQELQAAFLSVDGLRDFVESKIGSLERSANADEFMVIKYMLGLLIINGNIQTQVIQPVTKATADDVVTTITELTNNFQFPSTDYNMAGAQNTTPIDNIMVLESSRANAYIKVNSLATAYNVDYVKFMGQVTMFDQLGNLDWERLDKLFEDDKSYQRFTTEQIAQLNTVDFIVMDRNFPQIYDRMYEMGEPFINGEGLFTNYFFHVWQILSVSPFHNCVAFSTTTSSITGITVTPSAATLTQGSMFGLSVTTTGTGFVPSGYTWSISGNSSKDTFIGEDDILHIAANETAGGSITVTATSTSDTSISGSATITIA